MADHGDRVLCHACGGVSLKEEGRDLTCPHCESDFTEIIEIPPDTDLPELEPSTPPRRNYPFADEDESMFATRWDRRPQSGGSPIGFMEPMFQESPRYSRHSYRSPDGRFTFTTTSIRGGASNSFQQGNGYPNPTVPMMMQGLDSLFQTLSEPHRQENRHTQMPHSPGWNEDLHRGLDDYPDPEEQAPQDRTRHTASPPEGSLADFLASFNPDYERRQRRQSAFGGAQGVAGPNPLAMLSALMNMTRNGDAVYSQEELDRVISGLIHQAPGTAPPPASTTAIRSLPKKKIDREMLGSDGNAECSICMDAVELGTEVTVLPCTHWFHFPCIEAWLNQHNTCPHCRRAVDIDTTCRSVPRSTRSNPRAYAFGMYPRQQTMRHQTMNQDRPADSSRPTSTTGNGTSDDPVIIQDSPEQAPTRRRGRSSPFSSLRGRTSFSRSSTNSSGPNSPTPDQNGTGTGTATRRSSRSSRNSGNSREGQRGVGGWFWSRFGGTSST